MPISKISEPEPSERVKYFYAEAAAGMYDGTIELVVPRYRALHETLLWLMETHLPPLVGSAPAVVLDVGSGTGMESAGILRTQSNVRVVAVDLCTAVQDVHREKMLGLDSRNGTSLAERCDVVCGDVLEDLNSPEALLGLLPTDRTGDFSAVVTSLAVHHFSHQQKQDFYDLAYKVLRPGGVFINADLFSHADPELNGMALKYDLDWMRTQFVTPSAAFTEAHTLPPERRMDLLRRWLEHYDRDNRLEPIEDPLTDGAESGQARMLLKSGFGFVQIAYRFSLSGILLAKRI